MENSEKLQEKTDFTLMNKITVLLGKRNSGKSILALELIKKELHNFDRVYLFSPTEKINKFFTKGGVVESNCIFDTFDEGFVKAVFKKIEQVNSGLEKENQKKVLFILDDVIGGEQNIHSSHGLSLLAVRGRHINISVIILIQSMTAVHPLLRGNTDTMLVSTLNSSSVETLAQGFCLGKQFSVKKFIDMYERTCTDYTFLCINNQTTKSNSISEIYSSMRVNL